MAGPIHSISHATGAPPTPAALRQAVAAMEAKRQYLLLESVHESALAYQEFITQAAAAMQALPEALQQLRARTTQVQAQAQAELQRSRETLDRYLAELDKVDDSAPAEVASGQNLGRSHDADIRRALAAGTGVIKQGYLMKTARTWGWRRRFFVLDAHGMLTYYNEKARERSDAVRRQAEAEGRFGYLFLGVVWPDLVSRRVWRGPPRRRR